MGGTTVPAKAETAPPQANPAVSAGTDPEKDRVRRIPLQRIEPSSLQPRKDFAAEALQELADSIRAQGIVQPLIVRPKGTQFELIAGERRWRAAQLVGLQEVPVIVREAEDRAVLELALIENLQRENLNAMEEALAYAQLIEQFQLTQEQAATKVGRSRVSVANALRLLKLPSAVQTLVRSSQLSVGHAKVILSLESAQEQTSTAQRVLDRGWSVRQTEDHVAHLQKLKNAPPPAPSPGAPAAHSAHVHVADLENRLQERFGTKVSVRYRGGRGSVEIRFFSDAELERILEVAGVRLD